MSELNSFDDITVNVGLPPGALIHIGQKKETEVKLTAIQYNEETFKEILCESVEKCVQLREPNIQLWLNIDGLHDVEQIRLLGEDFALETLLLEDVLNTYARPKYEEFKNQTLVSFKMLGIDPQTNSIVAEQVSLVLGQNWLISFQEQQGDLFDGLRERLKHNKNNIRVRGSSYLLYRLMDIVVDNYFLVLETLQIEARVSRTRQY